MSKIMFYEFDDLTADEFATHRTDISLLWLDETMDEWANTIHESRSMNIPFVMKPLIRLSVCWTLRTFSDL